MSSERSVEHRSAISPSVVVTIVAYKSAHLLRSALASVNRESLFSQAVVIDHADGADIQVAQAAGALAIHDPTNPGFGAGQNRAVAASEGPYVLILNPDCVMESGALAEGVSVLDDDPSLGAVGGVIKLSDGTVERAAGDRTNCTRLVFRALAVRRLLRFRAVRTLACRTRVGRDHLERQPRVARDVSFLTGAAILVRRTAFDSIGGFDEEFFLYGEDVDLCRRLEAAGWRLRQIPTPWATHVGSASSSDPWRREALAWQGSLREAAKWWSPFSFFVAMAAAAIRWVTLAVCRPSLAPWAAHLMIVSPMRARRQSSRLSPSFSVGASAGV